LLLIQPFGKIPVPGADHASGTFPICSTFPDRHGCLTICPGTSKLTLMNTQTDSVPTRETPAAAEITPNAPSASPDDEFANETLGERQAEACSLDDGCTVCQ
jgi:hypothetical protein